MGKSKKCSSCSCNTPCVPKTEKVTTQVTIPASLFTAGDTGTVSGYSISTAVITPYVGAAFGTSGCSPCGTSTSYVPTDLLITSAHAFNSTGNVLTSNGAVFGVAYSNLAGVVTLTLTANIANAAAVGLTAANGATVLQGLVLVLSGSKLVK